MNMHVRKVLLAIILVFVASLALVAAPQAVLANIQGKVEVKLAGTTSWVPATEGMEIGVLSTVSTGFDASVTIVIDKTTIAVKPLTRMTVDKLVEEQGKVTTSCYLRVGSVQANVKSAEGVKQDFKVKSPYSTASVRGTVFTYTGLDLAVTEGLVSLIPGRPERDIDLPPGLSSMPDLSGDFAGAPDTPADPDLASSVGAGNSAGIVLGPGNVPGTRLSNDQNVLSQNSTVSTSTTTDQSGGNQGTSSGVTGGSSGQSGFGNVQITWIEE